MNDLKLPENLTGALKDFVASLKDIYSDGLISVVLYGSAASGEFVEKHSNVNVMVVLTDTGLTNLSKAYPIVSSRKLKMITPVFFTEEYILSSLDVFPIEFLDIKENYSILYGKDVVKDLKIDIKNLRFQCEQELKSKLINVKRHYLATKNRRDLENMLFKTFTSTIHIMRNLLRLKGQNNPPYIKEQVLSQAENAFGINTAVLNEILLAKKKKTELTHTDIDALLVKFVSELEKISSIVDKL